jgi:vacuolar-type H+-ATPase subunit C/Vma6
MMKQPRRFARVLAKIGAERSKLLSESKIKTLTETKDIATFASQLRDTSYQAQIAKMPSPINSRKLERAFNETLIETYAKIVKNSPQSVQALLNLYLLKFEIENLKTLIKIASDSLTAEQKLSRVYLSVEDYLKNRATVEEAAKATSIRQMINSLKNSSYAPSLNLGLQGYEENGSTARFDILLDRVYYLRLYESYTGLPKGEKSHAKYYVSLENDAFTLLTILRGKVLNFDASWLRQVIPQNNFNLTSEAIDALLAASDFDAALKVAMESHYGRFFAKAPTPEEAIANADKAFRKATWEHAKTSRISDNFNIGASIAFLVQKEAEVHNLVAASAGVEASINPEYIQNQLLL